MFFRRRRTRKAHDASLDKPACPDTTQGTAPWLFWPLFVLFLASGLVWVSYGWMAMDRPDTLLFAVMWDGFALIHSGAE